MKNPVPKEKDRKEKDRKEKDRKEKDRIRQHAVKALGDPEQALKVGVLVAGQWVGDVPVTEWRKCAVRLSNARYR
ncbi:MAG: hypothetical protein OXC84_13400 [Gammaproteobacteria bacterium]|nr:hypothetical protein [Gammaproteobacteria bacterium]